MLRKFLLKVRDANLALRLCLSDLAGSQYFSKFDLSKGYWGVPVNPEDRDVTTFVTHRGLFRFKVMPFGLINAPANEEATR